jgi:3-hydroxyisobutyrate dehydrogenase-like beta-hydroxyacid dehydrogenase
MKAVFIGLGRMGIPMAKNMISSGKKLGLYNRTKEKADIFKNNDVDIYPDLEDALSGADIVFTVLSDDYALSSVINPKTIALTNPGAIHVSHSTVSPEIIKKISSELNESGRLSLVSPVMGRPIAAENGNLKLLVSGPKAAKEKALGYLECLGQIYDFGEDPQNAILVKLAFNFMIASLIETLSESFSFLEKNHVEPKDFYSLITETLFSAPAVKTYGEIILEKNFDKSGFLLTLGQKDLSLVIEQAKISLSPLPIADILKNRLMRAVNRGWGEKDWCAIADLAREDSGLKKVE